MEDLSVQYDGTVRDGMGKIVQCLYNGDGLDATFLENVDGLLVPIHLKRTALRFPGPVAISDLKEKVHALVRAAFTVHVASRVMQTYPSGLSVDPSAFLRECERRAHRAHIEPGTMVGPLAATAIGSPVNRLA